MFSLTSNTVMLCYSYVMLLKENKYSIHRLFTEIKSFDDNNTSVEHVMQEFQKRKYHVKL